MTTANQGHENYKILTQYIKDFSFEHPSSPQIFFEKIEEKPKVEINVDIKAKKIGEELFDIALQIKINNQVKDKTLFVLELDYSSVAHINKDVSEEERERIILIEVPQLTFPYARSIVTSITKDCGLPPLVLHNINFKEMFKNRKKES